MTLSNQQVRELIKARYKGYEPYIADSVYTPIPRAVLEKAIGEFWEWARGQGLHRWEAEKGDCDDWSWLFKAYMIMRNLLSGRETAIPVFMIWYEGKYHVKGMHSIGFAIIEETDGSICIVEVEPQPGNGLMDLPKDERYSACLKVG